MNAITTPTDEAEALRHSALRKIDQARALIDSARADLSNLEGAGYCRTYESLLKPWDQLAKLARALRGLKPPTGIFRW